MYIGLNELQVLLKWTINNNFFIQLTPIRRFFSIIENQEIVQTKQGYFEGWM